MSQACTFADVHYTTMIRWIHDGKVSATKDFKGRLVVDAESLKAHLAKTSPVRVPW